MTVAVSSRRFYFQCRMFWNLLSEKSTEKIIFSSLLECSISSGIFCYILEYSTLDFPNVLEVFNSIKWACFSKSTFKLRNLSKRFKKAKDDKNRRISFFSRIRPSDPAQMPFSSLPALLHFARNDHSYNLVSKS